METFIKEISFISQEFIPNEQGGGEWKPTIVKKNATFKELNRTDPTQKKLTWKIMGIFEGSEIDGENSSVNINTDGLSDITDKYVKTMLLVNDEFTETNKKEFLLDNGSMMKFGLWALQEKITPFFSELMKD